GRQRPCQHGVTCPVIAGRGREVALPQHCQSRDHGNQTRRNGRPRERTGGATAVTGHRSHGAALRLVTVAFSFGFCSCSIALITVSATIACPALLRWTRS